MVIFIIVWSIWFISEIILNRFLRSGKNLDSNQDKKTIRIIWVTIGIANSLGIIIAIFLRAPICNGLIVPFISAILYRINIEEKLLIDQFNGEYLDYMKKTYRLIPWIY